MYKIGKDHDYIFSNAKKIVVITIILYVIIRQLFFLVFIDSQYWLPRSIINAVIAIFVFFVSRSKKLTRRQMSWMIPVSISLLENICSVLTGGDQMLYTVLIGCALLSLLFADNYGLVVTVLFNSIATLLFRLLFGFSMLGDLSPFEYNVYHYTAMVITNVLICIIGRYIIGAIVQSRNEKELADSRIEAIIGNLPGMVYQHLYNFPKCTLTYVSKGSKEYIGYAPEELIGDDNLVNGVNKFIAMVHPDDLEDVGDQFEKYIEAGLMHEQAYRIIMPDGSIKWIMDRSVVLEKNPDGTPYSVQGYMFDITEQKKLEAAELTTLMIDTSPMCIQIWDRNLNTIDCNESALRLYGFKDKAEYIGRFIKDCSPEYQPDGRRSDEKAAMLVKKAFEEGKCVFEWMHKMLDGTPMPAEITLVRVSYKEDYLVVGYTKDLRENVKMMNRIEKRTNELAFQTNMLQTIINSIPDIVFVKDLNLKFTMLNKSGEDFFGVLAGSIIGKDVIDGLKFSSNLAEEITVTDQKILGGDSITFEQSLPSFDGSMRLLETTKAPIVQNSSVVGIIGVARDITEKKQLEEVAMKAQIAEDSNRAKSDFLATMSHEIRTPMNAIIGMSELLLSENMRLDSKHLRCIRDIHVSAVALLNIINDILDFSKIQSGKLDIVPIHFDFILFIDNISSMVQFLNKKKNVIFKLVMGKELPVYLYGDDVRLRQVLLNIISNAVKFTNEGSVCLTVTSDDNDIHFQITDTGIGIKAEEIPKLFDAFTQVNLHHNRNIEGTGLGLSITKSLLDLMGGRISVESVFAHHTTFHVTIPKVLGNAELIPQHNSVNEVVFSAPDAKVLVVDDNSINLNVAAGFLRLCKIDADTTSSGMEAIEMIRSKEAGNNQYDIVFMDYMMPDMNGVETVKVLRADGFTMPIIALTANTMPGAKEEFFAAGMNDLLTKPVKKALLNQMLKDWLPKEKVITSPLLKGEAAKYDVSVTGNSDLLTEESVKFMRRIEKIEGLSVQTGLSRISGQYNIYENSLRLAIKEIEKCDKNLKKFLAETDMHNFSIEVHSMKNTLAGIGSIELSNLAFNLESAAYKKDRAFCAANLTYFLEMLDKLKTAIADAFAEKSSSRQKIHIPPELLPSLIKIFEKLQKAFKETDFAAINDGAEKLDALGLEGTLQEEIKKIKSAALIMDYESAVEIINNILNN